MSSDRIVKPDSGNDLVLQNDDGSAKIEINENGTIPVTGTLSGSVDVSGGSLTTSSAQKQAIVDGATIEAQDLASGSGTSLPNNVQDAITRLGTVTSGTFNGTIGSSARANSIQPESGQSLVLKEDEGSSALTINTSGNTIIAGNVGVNDSSPDEKIHLSDGNFKIEKTGTSAYQEIFGADEYFTSTSSSAFDILTVTVPYTSDYTDAVTAKFRIHFHYYTWDTGTPRTATTVGEFLVLITRGSRAGNGANADQSLVSIGFEGTDTGGSTFSLADISDFATSRTGSSSATQTVTVQFTPPGVKASGCRTQVNVKFESLNYGYSDITFAGF